MPIYNVKKNIFFFFSLIVILGLSIISSSIQAGSLEVKYPQIGGNTINNISVTFPQYISYIAKLSLWISLAALFVIFAIASVRYITSTGNPPIMKDAKNQMIAALLGLGVVLSSYVILYTVNPELVRLRFNSAQIPKISTGTISITSLSALHNYNVVPVGQLVKEGIYGRHAMITASTTLNQLQKIIVKPKGVSIPDIDDIKNKIKNFPWDDCMNDCYGHTRGCCLEYDYSSSPPQCKRPNPTHYCQFGCTAECQGKKDDLIPCPLNFRSLELIEKIDGMIASVAAQCKCGSPTSGCCQCHGDRCSSCCDSETGGCGPNAGVTGCNTQPIGCPDAKCDTTTIKILVGLLNCAEGNTAIDVNELDKLRVRGAIDPKFPNPPLHTSKRFENGPDNIKKGLLQAQDIISNYNVTNYNSVLGVIESYGIESVSTTPLVDWMKPLWVKNKSDPLSFYINAGSYDPNYIPPYNPPNPPITTGNCSQNNGKEINDKGIKMTFFCQCPDPWGSLAIGSDSCRAQPYNQTMCRYGCVVTSLDMILKYYGIPGMTDPREALNTFKNNGCISIDDTCSSENGNLYWRPLDTYLKKHSHKLTSLPNSSLSDLKTKYFDNKTPILAYCTSFGGIDPNFGGNGGLHFIVLRGYETSVWGPEHSIVYIADPGWGNTSMTEAQYDEFGCQPDYIIENSP